MANKRGRPSLQDEAMKANVINMAWRVLHNMFVSTRVTEEAKQKVAVELCKKSVPQEVNLKGDILVQLADRMMEARQRFASNN